MNRLIEEVRSKCGGVQLQSDDVYMATTFQEFIRAVILRSRGIETKKPFTYDAVCSRYQVAIYLVSSK